MTTSDRPRRTVHPPEANGQRRANEEGGYPAAASTPRQGVEAPAWVLWYEAARPRTLKLSLASALLGTLLAWHEGQFSAWLAIAVLAVAVAAHVGGHLLHDYAHHLRRHAADPSARTRAEGRLPAGDDLLTGALIAFAAAGLVALVLVAVVGWPVLLLGLAGGMIAGLQPGLLYARPRAIRAEMALHATVSFLAIGPLAVGGAYFVQTGRLGIAALLPAAAMGLLGAATRYAREMYEAPTQPESEPRTARAFGATLTACVAAAYLALAAAVALRWLPWPVAVVLLTLPTALRAVVGGWRGVGAAGAGLQVTVARLHWRFGIAAAAGLALSHLLGG